MINAMTNAMINAPRTMVHTLQTMINAMINAPRTMVPEDRIFGL
jgi:hypothetical protein